MGRVTLLPFTEETLDRIRLLSQLQCTEEELAAQLGCAWSTFKVFKREHFDEVQAAVDDGRAIGRISLRRKQWKLAESNASMAIHLGKNILGQTDKQQAEVTVNGQVQHNHLHALVAMPAEERMKRILELQARSSVLNDPKTDDNMQHSSITTSMQHRSSVQDIQETDDRCSISRPTMPANAGAEDGNTTRTAPDKAGNTTQEPPTLDLVQKDGGSAFGIVEVPLGPYNPSRGSYNPSPTSLYAGVPCR